jgi:phosphatidylinositol glycan class O
MLFFVTGHGCQFNRLQLQVAFIGREEFSVFYGGFALAVNTLGHEAFPLLFIIRKELNNSDKGMKANVFVSTMLRDYLVFRMLLLFLTCLATFILRRHLMLWAIFAPKLIFEVAMGGVSLGATFVLLYAGNKPN